MAFKFIILSALAVAAANAGVLPLAYQAHSAPLALHTSLVADEHQYAPPHYAFSYDVHDLHTGDIKSQEEKREGDVVVGRYSLIEPDGSRRTVEYTADDHSGFNAVVHREPGHHPVAIKAPVAVHHAPTLTYQAHQPAIYSSYAAPSLAISHHEPLGYSGYSSHY